MIRKGELKLDLFLKRAMTVLRACILSQDGAPICNCLQRPMSVRFSPRVSYWHSPQPIIL